VEREFLVDVGGADHIAWPGGGHVEVVRSGLEAGGHDVQVHLRDEAVDHEVDSGERLDERLLVVDVQLEDLRLAGGELAGDHLRSRRVDVGEDDLVDLGYARHRARRHLADGTYA